MCLNKQIKSFNICIFGESQDNKKTFKTTTKIDILCCKKRESD